MNIRELLAGIKNRDKTDINEAEAKMLLKEYGVPVVPETVATDYQEAVSAANALGYPVVVKGLGSALAHKTERGLVHLNLSNAQDVLVRVERAAVCVTDLAIVAGAFGGATPRVIGHEVAGTVVAAGTGVEALADGRPEAGPVRRAGGAGDRPLRAARRADGARRHARRRARRRPGRRQLPPAARRDLQHRHGGRGIGEVRQHGREQLHVPEVGGVRVQRRSDGEPRRLPQRDPRPREGEARPRPVARHG